MVDTSFAVNPKIQYASSARREGSRLDNAGVYAVVDQAGLGGL
jgi:hypothetical protein